MYFTLLATLVSPGKISDARGTYFMFLASQREDWGEGIGGKLTRVRGWDDDVEGFGDAVRCLGVPKLVESNKPNRNLLQTLPAPGR